MKAIIRQILSDVARLDVPVEALDDQADLYAAGLSSLATVHVMLAIENAFNIEIPDAMLSRQLFRSVNSLAAAAEELQS
ncbi:acyl carrier protein [Cupriavidus sp. 2TAF22]|uniref:acyl carrier protein n=1 Tax=unclassified Cupriavidus TaxID=2640874 RepID=UPI003F9294E3